MKRIIIECTPSEFEPMLELLMDEFKDHRIYGWDEAYHYTVTPQEIVKLIRVYNAVMQKRLQDITVQDRKIVDRMRTLFRGALAEIREGD